MSQVVGGGGSAEPEDPSAEGDDGGSPANKAAGSAVAAARQGVAAAVESSASAARKVGDGAKSALDATTDTAARAKRTAGSAVAATREGAAAAAESTASAARKVGDGAKSALDATTGSGAKALSAVQSLLATDTVATAVNAVVAAAVKGPATAFDKALDANYLDPVLRPALGGSYHCLFDGSHTVAGAFAAVRDDSVDAPIVEEALGTVHALLKDASTPRGLPLATWDKETFDAVASSLDSTFGIPKRWFYELNTYDTADLLGASVGVVSVVFCWNRADTEAFSQLAASMGLSAAVAVNPLLLVVSVVAFARAFHKARDGGHADLVDGAFKGVVTTGATLATVSVVGSVGGPAVALPAGIVAGVIASAATKNVSLSAVGRFAAAKAAEMLPHAVAAPRDRAEEPTTGSQTSAAAAATTE